MIIGLSTGLSVISTSRHHTISIWDQAIHIKEIKVAKLIGSWVTILTLDEEGKIYV